MTRFWLSGGGLILFIWIIVEVKGESLDLKKEAARYKKCQGHDFQLGPYLTKALTAFATGGCLKFSEYSCSGLCVVKHFDGGKPLIKEEEGYKFVKNWMKAEIEHFKNTQDPALSKPIDRLFKAFQECDNWAANEVDGGRWYNYPTESSDTCSDVNLVKSCIEAKHAKICKEEVAAEDFLDV